MSLSNEQSHYFQSQDNDNNYVNQGLEEIFISNYISEGQNNHLKFNSIQIQDHYNADLNRIKKKIIKRVKPQISKPGETKNIPKNIASVLKKFIQNILSNSKDETLRSFSKCRDWIKFKHIPHENIKKKQIELFMQTPFGKLIGKQFFGNCLWAPYFVSENKTNVSLYYKYNIKYFQQIFQKSQTSTKNSKITENQQQK